MQFHVAIGVSSYQYVQWSLSWAFDRQILSISGYYFVKHQWIAPQASSFKAGCRMYSWIRLCCDWSAAHRLDLEGGVLYVRSPHICSIGCSPFLEHSRTYGFPAESVQSSKCPVQSFDHRKSKCRKNFNFAASLRHHRESQDLQAW